MTRGVRSICRRKTRRLSHTVIATDAALLDFCPKLAAARRIAFDTEFVSEHTYRSVLCLVQVAADEHLAVIDPFPIRDLTPFWRIVAGFAGEVVVHAGREEMDFCSDSAGHQPARLVDLQVAAGLVGIEYPAGYGSLISKLLGRSSSKGETRTDWRRRPLSDKQIAYAVDDARYLLPLRDAIEARLTRLRRGAWLTEEMAAWQAAVAESLRGDRWRRVTGSSGLAPRALAIVRELWRWRDAEAARRDRPARQVFRDDLIVELAKRRSSDPQQISAVRGFERRDFQRVVPELSEAIARALALPDHECPPVIRRESNSQLNMVAQFLSSALTSVCRAREVAPSLVGTAEDVRELVAARMEGRRGDESLALACGWRAEVVGQLLDDLLAGKTSIRIQDPASDHPLAFDPVG